VVETPVKNVNEDNKEDEGQINLLEDVFINNNRMNINEAFTDLHDNAFFLHIDRLNHMNDLKTYSEYKLTNTPSPTTTTTTTTDNIFKLNRNHSLKDIIGLVSKMIPKEGERSEEESIKPVGMEKASIDDNNNNNSNDDDGKCTTEKCDCTAMSEHKEILTNFFTFYFNGNSFKYKHFLSVLNRIIEKLNNSLNNNNNNNNDDKDSINTSNNIINKSDSEIDPLINDFEVSQESIDKLKATVSFLTSPCIFNLFKTTAVNNQQFPI
jgi:hypothetical protein